MRRKITKKNNRNNTQQRVEILYNLQLKSRVNSMLLLFYINCNKFLRDVIFLRWRSSGIRGNTAPVFRCTIYISDQLRSDLVERRVSPSDCAVEWNSNDYTALVTVGSLLYYSLVCTPTWTQYSLVYFELSFLLFSLSRSLRPYTCFDVDELCTRAESLSSRYHVRALVSANRPKINTFMPWTHAARNSPLLHRLL